MPLCISLFLIFLKKIVGPHQVMLWWGSPRMLGIRPGLATYKENTYSLSSLFISLKFLIPLLNNSRNVLMIISVTGSPQGRNGFLFQTLPRVKEIQTLVWNENNKNREGSYVRKYYSQISFFFFIDLAGLIHWFGWWRTTCCMIGNAEGMRSIGAIQDKPCFHALTTS